MSRAMDAPEQDVGVGDGDGLPTYENLAEAHGPNSRCARLPRLRSIHDVFSTSLLVQVRQVEELDREEVISFAYFHHRSALSSFSKSR
jgi:hypothetical protein